MKRFLVRCLVGSAMLLAWSCGDDDGGGQACSSYCAKQDTCPNQLVKGEDCREFCAAYYSAPEDCASAYDSWVRCVSMKEPVDCSTAALGCDTEHQALTAACN
jgi:hypothetical protein